MTDDKPKGLSIIMALGKKPEGDSPSTESEPDGDEGCLTPPKGFTPPDNVGMGESFSTTVDGHLDKDGKFVVEKLGGVPMDGKPEEEADPNDDKEEEQNEGEPPLNPGQEDEPEEGDGMSDKMKRKASLKNSIRKHFGG